MSSCIDTAKGERYMSTFIKVKLVAFYFNTIIKNEKQGK